MLTNIIRSSMLGPVGSGKTAKGQTANYLLKSALAALDDDVSIARFHLRELADFDRADIG